ncbi:amino acid/amide ABC transporter substrate-binding protein, HAAT family [Arboricoccus pini]|uniref:Amino acid/amide ABC transporter substrate-binding protein, HAAT family n=1 Tax=Arboricoccus pini TaxID=1963835 RepID=A0A212RGP0_9PROT|nr:transporter substrate-binding domain-containing protein [Arboricoccus pini]SNB71560.1 amino acid/amide ABC transporter substrate-binding protein, HAAT family [Arboricoccus pini]
MEKRRKIPVGLLYSTTGPYAPMGQDGLDGALLAFEEANAEAGQGAIEFVPVISNPMGDLARYPSLARRLLLERGCRQLMGTITSAARKEVIPTIEKHDGLLWYTCPHEGFETNENVIYVGACPNQHLLPLLRYILPRHEPRLFLLGSNYIWGWEINRIARTLTLAAGGKILGERYLGLGEVTPRHLLVEILRKRPAIILNNLIGTSCHAFLRAFDELRQLDPLLAADCRVVSCDLVESELAETGPAAAGCIAALSHLASLDTKPNQALARRLAVRFGPRRTPSAYVVGAYIAAWGLIRAVRSSGSDATGSVKQALHDGPQATPLGPLHISARDNYAALPCYIGEATTAGTYRRLAGGDELIVGDPYLADINLAAFAATFRPVAPRTPTLRIVS